MPTDKFTNPVCLFSVSAKISADEGIHLIVLAFNEDWAHSVLSPDADYEEVTIKKMSGVVAMAEFGMRNVTGEEPVTYLNYHCRPVEKGDLPK